MRLWTVGHSSHTLSDFLALLTACQIERVVDVRRFPGSRKHPQFGERSLAVALREAEIEYVRIPQLGGRRRPVADSPNTAWRNPSFRAYADYMATSEFQSGIDRLLVLAAERRTACMCAEALWWRCHRALIADHLKANGHEVLHILSRSGVQPHPYTSAARLVAGRLSYQAEPATPQSGAP